MALAFTIDAIDNVATLLEDTTAARVQLLGLNTGHVIATGPIALGHKIALRGINAGETICKYGVAIGQASRHIERGDWVHLHNCQSLYDARSNDFDVETGAATDTRYA